MRKLVEDTAAEFSRVISEMMAAAGERGSHLRWLAEGLAHQVVNAQEERDALLAEKRKAQADRWHEELLTADQGRALLALVGDRMDLISDYMAAGSFDDEAEYQMLRSILPRLRLLLPPEGEE